MKNLKSEKCSGDFCDYIFLEMKAYFFITLNKINKYKITLN